MRKEAFCVSGGMISRAIAARGYFARTKRSKKLNIVSTLSLSA